MYIAVNESSTHTVEDDLPCEVMMQFPQSMESLSRTQKSVSFAEEALLYASPLFIDEVCELWYSQEEYVSLKDERRTSVKLLRFYGSEAIQNKVCIRGLEAYFSVETNKAIREARETAIRTVLNEQRLQRQLGYYDEEALRSVYIPTTEWMRNRALELARSDALWVARLSLSLSRPVSNIARTSFQKTMTHQRSQTRLLQEDNHDHMDGIMSKLENAMHLVKTLDINPHSRTCYDEYEPIRLNRM